MKTTTILFVLLWLANSIFCQQAKKEIKIKFTSINSLGLLSGSNGESSLIQTINGINKGRWSSGIGTGIDFYVERGVPLFLDIRRDLLTGKKTPFVYTDAGVNFPWLNFIQKEQRHTFSSSAGMYYDIGGGWKFKISKHNNIVLSTGYTFKQSKGEGPIYIYNPLINTNQELTQHMDYKYRRLSIKIGLQF